MKTTYSSRGSSKEKRREAVTGIAVPTTMLTVSLAGSRSRYPQPGVRPLLRPCGSVVQPGSQMHLPSVQTPFRAPCSRSNPAQRGGSAAALAAVDSNSNDGIIISRGGGFGGYSMPIVLFTTPTVKKMAAVGEQRGLPGGKGQGAGAEFPKRGGEHPHSHHQCCKAPAAAPGPQWPSPTVGGGGYRERT